MKKIIGVLMTLVLTMTFSVSTFSDEADLHIGGKILSNETFDYYLIETTQDDGTVVRTYLDTQNLQNRENGQMQVCSSVDPYERTKAILMDLGMDEFFISQLQEPSLSIYQNAKQITTTTSYIKTDIHGNVTVVSEAEALAGAAQVNLQVSEYNKGEESKASAPGVGENITDTSQDEYMKMTLITTYMGGAKYMFATTGDWLTMPTWRSTDSLGICAQGHTPINSSCGGYIYYSYDKKTGIFAEESDQVKEYLTPEAFYPCVEEGWSGVAAVFNLKNNTVTTKYTSYKAYMEFQSQVTYPGLELYFNATATYHHSEFQLNIESVSIGIDMQGTVSGGIGITNNVTNTRRYVSSANPYHYVPV